MQTIDRLFWRAPLEQAYEVARAVEQWPERLRHYRWVRLLERGPKRDVVEMSANRPFGPLQWPTWWVSEMWLEPDRHVVRYRHIRGITTGMEVEWRLQAREGGTDVTIVHDWNGPAWPLIRRPAAEWVIGPVFVHGIASRTLQGLGMVAESLTRAARGT